MLILFMLQFHSCSFLEQVAEEFWDYICEKDNVKRLHLLKDTKIESTQNSTCLR